MDKPLTRLVQTALSYHRFRIFLSVAVEIIVVLLITFGILLRKDDPTNDPVVFWCFTGFILAISAYLFIGFNIQNDMLEKRDKSYSVLPLSNTQIILSRILTDLTIFAPLLLIYVAYYLIVINTLAPLPVYLIFSVFFYVLVLWAVLDIISSLFKAETAFLFLIFIYFNLAGFFVTFSFEGILPIDVVELQMTLFATFKGVLLWFVLAATSIWLMVIRYRTKDMRS